MTTEVDVLVVGAGIAGIYAAHKIRELGCSVAGVERGEDFGGTWYWNRYPGLRCDVESIFYSYSFDDAIQQEWTWEQKFPSQPEILSYLGFVVDRLELRPSFRFGVEITSATWEEGSARWLVSSADGERFSARFVVWATGILSTQKIPDFAGQARFRGLVLNSATWPEEEQDFRGKRVAVIGTGSTGIQLIPIIAEQAEHLHVLARTPSYSLPAYHRLLEEDEIRAVKAGYPALRAAARGSMLGVVAPGAAATAADLSADEAQAVLQASYDYGSPMLFGSTFDDLAVSIASNEVATEFVRRKIRERVSDPEIAAKLIPDYPILTRRLCIDTGYYETFDRDSVTLVDLREDALIGFTERGFQTAALGEVDVDVIVYATGFDAMTGTLRRIDITGRDGASLREKWGHAPSTYLGIAVAGFPNMWTVTGPGSPSASSNVVLSIEQHVEWIADQLSWMRAHGKAVFEPDPAAEQAWVKHVADVADATVVGAGDSWYTGANVAGKPRVVLQYLGGVGPYEARLRDVAAHEYEGFRFDDESARTEGAVG